MTSEKQIGNWQMKRTSHTKKCENFGLKQLKNNQNNNLLPTFQNVNKV